MWANLTLVIAIFHQKTGERTGEREVPISINLNHAVSIRRNDDNTATQLRALGSWNGDNVVYTVRETPEEIWAKIADANGTLPIQVAPITTVVKTSARRKKQ